MTKEPITLKHQVTSYYHTGQSLKSRVIYYFLKLVGLKFFLRKQTTTDIVRKAGRPLPPKRIPKNIGVTAQQIQASNVFTIAHTGSQCRKHIIYLHGGAFVVSFASLHWAFMFKLVLKTQCTVIAPDYPLSPEYSYKERFALLDPLYKDLAERVGSKNIIIMGDSSGGNIALALAQKTRFEHLPAPDQIILLSPWLDVTMTNPEIAVIDKKDPLISSKASDVMAKAHAGDLDMKHFLVSPLYGPLRGIGTVSLFTGTCDILNPDARILKAKAEAEGADFHYFEYRNMIHVWILFPMPEAAIALRQIIALIKDKS